MTHPAINKVATSAGFFTPAFAEYLTSNVHVYDAFECEAKRVVAKGFKHYSARTIIEVLRHHSALTQARSQWRLNNDNTPYLARLFSLLNPLHSGLFEFRAAHAAKSKQKVGALVTI